MKCKFLSLVALLLVISRPIYSQWYLTKFVIGSYADPRLSPDNDKKKDSLSFTLAKLASINLLSGPQYYNGSMDYSLMDRTLALAAKYDMHVLLIDSKLNVTDNSFSEAQAQNIISHFESVDANSKKAIGGYYLSGEHPRDKAGMVRKWSGYFSKNDPDKLAYTYLLPSYGFKTRKQYEDYLDSYLKGNSSLNSPSVVAFDNYPFISDATLGSYFYNLAIIREKAGNKPVWYYVQTTTKKSAPDITDYQMRFMAYCPLAYGAKGVLYYTYESIPTRYGVDYHDALINPFGNVTKKYFLVKFINLYLAHVAGPVIMQNSYAGTYHVSSQPTQETISARFLLNSQNKYIQKIDNPNILAGVFKDNKSDKYYLMLINKSSDDINNLRVTVPGKKDINAFPGSDNYKGSVAKTKLSTVNNKNNTNTSFSIAKIPGGEMTVLEID